MRECCTTAAQIFLIALSIASGGRATAGVNARASDFATPPGITYQGANYGNGDGFTLYVSSNSNSPNCGKECQKTWVPVIAGKDDQSTDDWTLVDTTTRQWGFQGKPV